MGIFDKAKDLAASNPDKANEFIDKAGDMVDEKTGGKYTGQVDQGQDLLRGHLGTEQAEAPPAPEAPPAEAPPAPEAPPAEAPPAPEAPQAEAPPVFEGEQPPA